MLQNVPEKLYSKQLIIRHILISLQNLREKTIIKSVGIQAKKTGLRLFYSSIPHLETTGRCLQSSKGKYMTSNYVMPSQIVHRA